MKEITLTAVRENVETVTRFVDEMLERMNCPVRTRVQLLIAIDELFSNIANYAYTPKVGQVTIRVEAGDDPRCITITFIDSGIPYNPLAAKDPDVTLPAMERRIGGLGVYMVKKSMDTVTYQYKDRKNMLTVRKYI